jgi:hypothetical protein
VTPDVTRCPVRRVMARGRSAAALPGMRFANNHRDDAMAERTSSVIDGGILEGLEGSEALPLRHASSDAVRVDCIYKDRSPCISWRAINFAGALIS